MSQYPSNTKDIPADARFVVFVNSSYLESGWGPNDPPESRKVLQTVFLRTDEELREFVESQNPTDQATLAVFNIQQIKVTRKVVFEYN